MPRLLQLARAAVLTALLASPGLVTLPVVQVLSTRVVTPRPTLTMLERARDAALAGESPRIDARPLALEDAGPVPRAVVSSEDGLFFVHDGFDLDGICAAWKSNQGGGRLRGGSTITQQVARNAFLFQRRSWVRKGLEAGYTVLLEGLVPKTRILELYLE
ncbi:MAG: transglycosylase domain-containing protein, partial [Myxococcales bacterium]|nr:transglycosylase domain-containing protein [Myxococcales bacterium]